MVKGVELKTFTKADVDKMVEKENRAIVIFEGDVFDATDFKVTHPGGPKYIEDNIGTVLRKKNGPCAKKVNPCAKKMTPVQKKWPPVQKKWPPVQKKWALE